MEARLGAWTLSQIGADAPSGFDTTLPDTDPFRPCRLCLRTCILLEDRWLLNRCCLSLDEERASAGADHVPCHCDVL